VTKLYEQVSLKNYNSFGIDVNARRFVTFSSEEDIPQLLDSLRGEDNKFVLGGGSNILFTSDYDGTVIKNDIKGIREKQINENEILLSIGAGEIWDEVVDYTVQKNYYGIENLSLIPGNTGAAPIQNIGAYGVELKDVFYSLEGYDIESGEKRIFNLDECKFGYRDSIFKNELKGKIIITKVNLKLSKKGKLNTNYISMKNYLIENNFTTPTLSQIREAVINIRNSKLPDPKKLGNAGSFFKNPIVTKKEYDELNQKYSTLSYFISEDGLYKISAGWLIEKCGLKGFRVGNVGTHVNQALVIVNYGGANGEEILKFVENIQTKVFNEFGILLEPEVNIINNNQQEYL